MDGILNINKPPGMTSFAVVARIKSLTREKHTGHAGTLDPIASGVLPVCLGQATRVIEYLFDETKCYRTGVRLGLTTDSYDITGKTLLEADPSRVSRSDLEAVLENFRGDIKQVPPMYSALKHAGQPLYKLAREGIEVERPARPAHIFRLELLDWQPPLFTLEVECSKGTYIRSLAHDIGQKLQCGAVMQSLIRLRVGNFRLEEALTLEQIAELAQKDNLERCLNAPDQALLNFPAVIVNQDQQCALVHGRTLPGHETGWPAVEKPLRAYNQDGEFVGMIAYKAESDHWQPEKIFLKPCCQTSPPENL